MSTEFDASQLHKGALDLAVLGVLAAADDYGYGIVRQIWDAGLDGVREASVYGTLTRLFRAGLLTTHLQASTSGPHRKYYGLSSAGRTYLADGTKAWSSTCAAVNHLLDLSTEGAS